MCLGFQTYAALGFPLARSRAGDKARIIRQWDIVFRICISGRLDQIIINIYDESRATVTVYLNNSESVCSS